MSEARCSIVRLTHSNVVNGSAEPMLWWRRQYRHTIVVNEYVGLPGVAGKTCREVHSRQDGRSSSVPNVQEYPIIKRPIMGSDATARNEVKVRDVINVTREGHPETLLEVRGADSSDEVPATGMDAKRSHFDGGSEVVRGGSSREGVVHE